MPFNFCLFVWYQSSSIIKIYLPFKFTYLYHFNKQQYCYVYLINRIVANDDVFTLIYNITYFVSSYNILILCYVYLINRIVTNDDVFTLIYNITYFVSSYNILMLNTHMDNTITLQ